MSPASGMSPRVLCARFSHLALVVTWRRHPELRAEPVVVGGAPELRLPILAASAAARASGVRSGQPLREAQQRCPSAAFVPIDEPAVSRLREELVACLYQLAPVVEVEDETAWCDLSGRHAAHPDGTGWAVSIARSINQLLDDDSISIGVAASRLVAGVAARQAGPRRVRRVATGEEAAFLAPLSLDVLAVAPAIAARLVTLGLESVGAVAALSAGDLQRQFGPAGLDLWRRARGQDGVGEWAGGVIGGAGQRVSRGGGGGGVSGGWGGGAAGGADGEAACSPPLEGDGAILRRLGVRLVLEGGTGDLEVLRFAVHRAAMEVGERLRRRGCRAASVTLVCEREDMAPAGLRITPLQPPGSGEELWPAALELLAGLPLTAPVTAIRLEVEGLQPGAGRQVDLWRGGDAAGEEIGATASRLRVRFGRTAVRRAELTVDPGDLPERRFRWADPVAAAGDEAHGTGVAAPAPEEPRERALRSRPWTAASGVPAAVMPALRR